jgi:chorismate mutase-like protein
MLIVDDGGWRPASLDEARQRIDAIDSAILDLLHQRAQVVLEVGRLKRETGGESANSAFRPAREVAMLRSLHARTNDPLAFATVDAVWREIVSGFTAAQKPLTILTSSATAALARNAFGAQAILDQRQSPADCLTALGDSPGAVALIPAVDTNWDAIMASGGAVVAVVPFAAPRISAWCVTMASPEPSGDDVTLIVTEDPDGAIPIGKSSAGHIVALPGFHMDRADAIGAYPRPLTTGLTTP